jgi:DNA-binding NarL/FixJ family response regulator
MKNNLYPRFGILAVDDEASWLRTLALSLERSAGITNLITCQDSREVMGLLARHEIGIVLLDLTMPHVSGEELLRRINEDCPDISVIVISGLNQLETAVRCVQAGAFDYFVKSSEEDRIIKGIRRAIRWQELQEENGEMRRLFLDDRMEFPEAFASVVTQDKGMRSIVQREQSSPGHRRERYGQGADRSGHPQTQLPYGPSGGSERCGPGRRGLCGHAVRTYAGRVHWSQRGTQRDGGASGGWHLVS